MNMLANPTLPSAPASDYALGEHAKEARMGGQGQETRAREVRVIDISDFDRRKAEIADAIWQGGVGKHVHGLFPLPQRQWQGTQRPAQKKHRSRPSLLKWLTGHRSQPRRSRTRFKSNDPRRHRPAS